MRRNDDTAVVVVWIELGSDLADFAGSFEAALLTRGLASELNTLLSRLGLAGEALVRIRTVESTRPVRVRVHSALQPYPPQMLVRAWLSVAPTELQELPLQGPNGSSLGFPAQWLAQYAHGSPDEPPPDLEVLRTCLERLAAQIVLERPSCLVGPVQVEAYKQALGRNPNGLAALMRMLLDLGVPLGDHEVVRRLIDEGEELKRPFEDTIEAAFTELRSHELEIQIHPATLRGLVLDPSEHEPFSVYDPRVDRKTRELFQNFERTFFSAFGFMLPGLRWAPTTAIEPGMVATRLGAWRSVPTPLLPAGERLVPVLAEKLRAQGVEAQPAVNPATGMACALVHTSLRETLEQSGLITWGPIDFVLLILVTDLSRRAGTLLGIEEVEFQLAQLPTEADELLPASARTALTLFSLGDLTRVLRAAVEERLSLRDLSGLLERLVQYDTIALPKEADHLLLLDRRLPVAPGPSSTNGRGARLDASWRSYYAFLRRQLSSYLSYFHAGSDKDKRVYAYTLDPETEALAQEAPSGSNETVLEALRDAVGTRLADSQAPVTVIATSTRARKAVRDLLAPEFPDLPVLAYAELNAEFDVVELGTISAFAGVAGIDRSG